MTKTKKISIRDICFISIFAAIITVCAQIQIPMPYGVPLTLQTFAIPLAGVVLGTKNGTIATLLYILLGAIGVPVFAGFTGGLGIVFGRTGGFILSFPLMALTAGIGAKKNHLWLTLWLVIGAIANFACGMAMFSLVTENSMVASFAFVVLPFLPTAAIKIGLVVGLGKLIKQALVKARVLV